MKIEPVAELARWVVEKASAIRNTDRPVPSFEGHPLSGAALQVNLFLYLDLCYLFSLF